MSDNHPTTCEQDARRESFVAELTSAAYPLVLRRGLKGSWIQAVLKMPPQRVARRTMALAVLLVGAGLPGQPPAPGFQPRGGGARPTDPRAPDAKRLSLPMPTGGGIIDVTGDLRR